MRLSVELKDGRRLSAARSSARGWPEQPATWDDIAGKYEECCAGILDPAQIKASIEQIGVLEDASSLQPLVRSLCATA
jgi:2-methylcitrate dehydratase PrpD